MSKISNKQRHKQLKEWDEWMKGKYPNYRERKLKEKSKPSVPLYSLLGNENSYSRG
jgi:hypothetical protein